MNEMEIFQNEEFGTVRTLIIEGEPYFVGKDVADILGYQNGSRDVNRHVDEEDRQKIMVFDGNQDKETIIINESGLYSLILSSKLPAAKGFKRWVTSEVLPSIRRHGLYAIDDIINNPDLGIAALQALKAEREKTEELLTRVSIQNQQIAELQPKASYYDLVLKCQDAIPINIIAKDYGWSAKKMNKFLHEKGIQYKQRDTWLLYAGYAERGYTKSETYPYVDSRGKERVSIHTKWTQAGRLFIYNLMTAAGHLPLVEQLN